MEPIYQNLGAEERFRTLSANCYAHEQGETKRQYSPEELEEMRKEFTTESILLGDVKDEKKDMVSEINSRIKNLEKVTKGLLVKVRKGYDLEKQTLFSFDDQENNVMNVYDSEGNFVSSRRLLPSEKQTRLTLKIAGNE